MWWLNDLHEGTKFVQVGRDTNLKQAHRCKIGFKIKKERFGSVTKCKAKCVVWGYMKSYGIGYDLIHKPVSRM